MYTLFIREDFVKAIFWHDWRYSVTNFLTKHMRRVSEDCEDYEMNLSEPEMWELCELWHEDDERFACGSPEMNSWFQEFVDKLI